MSVAENATGIAEEDLLRADLYDLLGTLLARPPSSELLAQLFSATGDDSALGRSLDALAGLARETTPEAAKSEYNALFIGLTRGELLPYSSYYQTGFLNEKPLALLRRDMARLGITRAPEIFEPEDHIASLCEMMAGLIRGRFGKPAALATQRDFFQAHLGPWAAHFFSDLEGTKKAALYGPVGAIGRAFMEVEREAFRMGD